MEFLVIDPISKMPSRTYNNVWSFWLKWEFSHYDPIGKNVSSTTYNVWSFDWNGIFLDLIDPISKNAAICVLVQSYHICERERKTFVDFMPNFINLKF